MGEEVVLPYYWGKGAWLEGCEKGLFLYFELLVVTLWIVLLVLTLLREQCDDRQVVPWCVLAAICNSRCFYNGMHLELQHTPFTLYSSNLHLRTACIDDVKLTDSEAVWNA